jgi:hypothetical protein
MISVEMQVMLRSIETMHRGGVSATLIVLARLPSTNGAVVIFEFFIGIPVISGGLRTLPALWNLMRSFPGISGSRGRLLRITWTLAHASTHAASAVTSAAIAPPYGRTCSNRLVVSVESLVRL